MSAASPGSVPRRAIARLRACPLLLLLAATTGFAAGPAPDNATAPYEVRFMTDMIDHHAMAVMMSEPCLQKAVHDELRTMCQDIISAQMQEIQMTQGWLCQWYGMCHAGPQE